MKAFLIAIIGTIFLHNVCIAAKKPVVQNQTERTSYSLGFQIGQDLKNQDLEIQLAKIRLGILDGIAGKGPAIDSQEMKQLLAYLKKRVVASQKKWSQPVKQKQEQDQMFLKKNASKEGIIHLSNGLQYKILSEGNGRKPQSTDTVTINYHGPWKTDNIIDTSNKKGRTTTNPVNKFIPGLSQGLQLMNEGSRIRLFIPSHLAYDEGALKYRTVIFEIELISVEADAK